MSSVSFNEGNINPPSATSGQIGEYLANTRKKARTIKAFTSQMLKTKSMNFNFTNISASSYNCTNHKIRLTKHELSHGCKLGLDSHADVSCVGKHARILEVIEGQTSVVRPFLGQI